MNQTVYALFPTHDEAHYAFQDLLSKGFARESISLAIHQNEIEGKPGGTLAKGAAATGLGMGLIYGGFLGAIIGIGTVFILPTGLILAGPLVWTLAGAASGGVTGGFLCGLVGYGIPKEEAEYYAEGVRRGGTLVIVGVNDSNIEEAERILDRDGAIDVKSRAEEYRKGGFQRFEESGRIYTEEEAELERSALKTSSSEFSVI